MGKGVCPEEGCDLHERELGMTYVGGPTALLRWGSLRLLTDPTFDPAGEEYRVGEYALRKTAGPAVSAESLGRVDAVLLSHDHHFDNLDRAGRAFLATAGTVLTTPAGAERLGNNAVGLATWCGVGIPDPGGHVLRVTATPARHGPADFERGPVAGFVLAYDDDPGTAVYVAGDTVWYDGVAEVARCYPVRAAILFMGAARVAAAGPWHLTMTAEEGVEAARAFGDAAIVPLHCEGWAHYTEARGQIARTFARAGLGRQVVWGEPGREIVIPLGAGGRRRYPQASGF